MCLKQICFFALFLPLLTHAKASPTSCQRLWYSFFKSKRSIALTTATGALGATAYIYRSATYEGQRYNHQSLEYVGFNVSHDPRQKHALDMILNESEYFFGIPKKLMQANFIRFDKDKLWELGNIPSPSWRENLDQFNRLPLGLTLFKNKGAHVVNTNCFSCHTGVTAGKVILGMPSTNFDSITQAIQSNLLPLFENSVILSQSENLALAGFNEHFQTIIRPSLKDVRLRGDNPGPYIIWTTIARFLDPLNSLELSTDLTPSPLEREILDKNKFPNVQPMPWWNLKYKKKSFWLSDVSHHSPTSFSLNLLDHHPEQDLSERMKRTNDMLYLAYNTKSPRYPFELDHSMVQRGHQVFHSTKARCYKCHGIYSQSGELDPQDFPNLQYKDVGTDPEFSKFYLKLKPLYDKANLLFIRFDPQEVYPDGQLEAGFPPVRQGYSPPPLKGIWASAPYFHNGSVPTLYQVLNSKVRKKIWANSLDMFEYDQDEVGLVHKEIKLSTFNKYQEKYENQSKVKELLLTDENLYFRRMYNTAEFGRSNSGHIFGDKLSEEERRDLIEFLKTL